MKVSRIFIAAAFLLLASCSKDNPVEDLGVESGRYRAQLSVSLSSRTLAPGDTLAVTATTSHRHDKINKVEFLHTLVEKFGVTLELNGGSKVTWSDADPYMVVTDTVAKNAVWKSVDNQNGELNNYYLAQSNNYVIRGEYTLFMPHEGTFPATGDQLLDKLPQESFEILKNQLAYNISVADYQSLLPEAGDENFTMNGATRTGISAAGREHLKASVTPQLLSEKGFKEAKKIGKLFSTVTVRVIAEAGTISDVNNSFESTY